ncbi:sulfatase family protein [Novipirellula artificiosorum]|uniref:Arylsulfatase n=1 Tax=Novipirellula artificiosorum TaxID=2528016 RepID=A0A5C6DEF3_9BACT|nr:sulfatase-like hydrolase/transferase [Novipirellula artificiosorum]TWU35048.1 Arylsulfatase [Novipirellula artificiosorum]
MKLPIRILFGFLAATAITAADEPIRPNVIVVLTDDQGWADLSCQGQVDDILTPNIDALADRGVRCTAGYVTAPQCSPSRAGLITGRHQQRFGIDSIPDMPLASEATTIAERLQPFGYRTGFVGKWHLEPNVLCINWMKRELPEMADKPRRDIRVPWTKIRPYSPAAQGFDEYYWGELQNYRVNYDLQSGQMLSPMQMVQHSEFRIDVQTEAAVNFIERNHSQPFYLHVGYYGPHTPLQATEEYLSRFPGPMPERRRYALAMIAAIDDGVGRIVDQLRKHGLLENTLIVMTSDNGAPLKMTKPDSPIDRDAGGWDGSLNDPWVGEKGMLTDGGLRVPMIWSFPRGLPSNKVYEQPISTLDIAPSVLSLAGGMDAVEAVKSELDGINVLPLMNAPQIVTERSLFFRFWDQAAIRQGKWKYLFVGAGSEYLFDLESDQHEQLNRMEEHPEIADRLKQELSTWTNSIHPPGMPRGEKQRERGWYEYYYQ